MEKRAARDWRQNADESMPAAQTQWPGKTFGFLGRKGVLDEAIHGAVSSVACAKQVHGASSVWVRGANTCAHPLLGADALITEQSKTALVIQTADCIPLLLAAKSKPLIAAVHLGWRGLRSKLLHRVVASIHGYCSVRPDELFCVIGPCIRSCCYEVGSEFERYFSRLTVTSRDGRRYCDLVGILGEQLRELGVRKEAIQDSRICTACHSDRWFSYRKNGPKHERNLAFIYQS